MIPFPYIEKLLAGSNYTELECEKILNRLIKLESNWKKRLSDLYQMEIDKIISDLKDSQLDPVTHGNGYNQTDIKNHLKKLR